MSSSSLVDPPPPTHTPCPTPYPTDSVSVVFLESPMPLASSGSPAATGAPSGVVDPMQMSFGVQTHRLLPQHHATWEYLMIKSGSKVAVTVELETPFLLLVPLVEGE